MGAVISPRLQRLAATVSIAVLGPLLLGPSAARASTDPVGGPLLGSRGVVVQRGPGAPKLPKITAKAWLVADLDTGEVLAARNPHGRYLPASTMKVLTAAALIPKLNPRKRIRPSFEAVNIEGSKVGIVQQRTYTVDQLFVAMLIASGNDAATALAEAAGGETATVRLMNAEAANLQAKDTHARNPHGLDAKGQLTSAYDLALIGRAALKLPAFARYNLTRKAHLPHKKRKKGTFEIYTHNRLLRNDYPGALGGKSGYTAAARHTFVGFAQRGKRRLVVAVLKADKGYYPDVEKLLNWGFKAAPKVQPVGNLVPPLDEVPPEIVSGSSSGTAAAGEAAALTDPADGRRLFGRRLRLPWWYGVAAVFAVAVSGLTLGIRRRRRRRRGFYGPRSKLRLPAG